MIIIVILIGTIFGYISDIKKESSWSGILLTIIGILILFPFDLLYGLGAGFSSDQAAENEYAAVLILLVFFLIFFVARWIRRIILQRSNKKSSP